MYRKEVAPEGWVAPSPLKLDDDEPSAPAATGGGGPNNAASAQAIAHTPANQLPLGTSEQQLFDGFTYTADSDLGKKKERE